MPPFSTKTIILIFCFSVCIKRNESSEDSYIGLDVLFRKSLICSRSILIFRDLTFDFFLVRFIFIVKRKAKSFFEQPNCKCCKKRNRLLVSTVDFNVQSSHRNTNFIKLFNFLKFG